MSHKGEVLFLDKTHPRLMEKLINIGYHCFFEDDMSVEKLVKLMPDLTGIIVRSRLQLGREELQHAVRLRFIGRVGSGLENIDVDYARSKGIACLNSPEGNRNAVGEHAAGMLLSLVNNICNANYEVKKGLWNREKNRGMELRGKTLGIIGYGHTGSAFARCMDGFGMKIIAYDKYKTGFGTSMVKEAGMEEIFNEAHILSLHIPLTNETRYLVDASFLSQFKHSIYLVNTSRGAVVNTSDLTKALKQGKLKGLALDVLEYEHLSFESLEMVDLPAPFRYLADHPAVVMTPHVAGWTHESLIQLSDVLFEKIRKLD